MKPYTHVAAEAPLAHLAEVSAVLPLAVHVLVHFSSSVALREEGKVDGMLCVKHTCRSTDVTTFNNSFPLFCVE